MDESVYAGMKELEDSIENPEQYYFWSLLSPKVSSNESDYGEYDTPNNDIENFLISLEKRMDRWEKVK